MTFKNARRLEMGEEGFENDFIIQYLDIVDQDEIIDEILKNLKLELKSYDVLDYIIHKKENAELDALEDNIKRIFRNILQQAKLEKRDIDCLEKEYNFPIYKINDLRINKVNHKRDNQIIFEI